MSIRLILPIFLLLLTSCSSSNISPCPKRPAFAGSTWGDLSRYTGSLERLYDSCLT